MTTGPLVLGVDAGGTCTRCLVAVADGRVLGKGEAGPANCLAVGTATAAANVMAAAERALAAAGCSMVDVAAVCVGMAGAGRPEEQAAVKAALSFPPSARVEVVLDARIALAGALGGSPGAIVIAGTGSIAYGVDARGKICRAGGWGWLLGDEGSAYAIGRAALRAALADRDGTGPRTVLRERVCAAWGIRDPEEAIPRVYADVPGARGKLAALAPLVTAAAEEGDRVAGAILQEAGRDLARLAAAVLRRLKLARAPVAPVGGVLTACRPLREAFAVALTDAFPGAQVTEPQGSPVEGALRLARRLLETPIL
ncbi:MAG TPA: BadF/BadG/BcrA/BcrD ATPase family protein [Symbiobacteriaceae bacterium]